ncbi:hypothetical protein CH371_15190 [Leptospira wolffii]|uniref:Uncharacterized protein n=1 Tax=Leptospira wolffii TaxID=409998 RepID=A0A2M9Z8V4_9LEPT|nr:hypothetical protein CH371_15190 [Leptospira wolffii]
MRFRNRLPGSFPGSGRPGKNLSGDLGSVRVRIPLIALCRIGIEPGRERGSLKKDGQAGKSGFC